MILSRFDFQLIFQYHDVKIQRANQLSQLVHRLVGQLVEELRAQQDVVVQSLIQNFLHDAQKGN